MVIGANPDLDEGRRRAVELDYGMQDGQSVLTTPGSPSITSFTKIRSQKPKP